MRCARCNSGVSDVVDSRHVAESIRRRRQCKRCRYRYTTYETLREQPVAMRTITTALNVIEREVQDLRRKAGLPKMR